MKTARRRIIWSILIMLLVACSNNSEPNQEAANVPTTTVSAPTETNDQVLTLADISDDPAEATDQMQPIADYLAARLSNFGVTRGEVRVVATANELAQLLLSGDIDLYFDSLYPATLIAEQSGAKALLRRWRRGIGEYYTIIYASKESGIQSLDDLPGHMVAMDNPFSTSGYVLPSVYLMERNFVLTPKQTYDEAVDVGEIGFVFSYDDQNAMQWVMNGSVDAGVTDNGHFADFPAEVTEDLIILAETDAVPRQVMLAQPNLDPALETAIVQLLLEMDKNEEGQQALELFDKTAKFDEFPEGLVEARANMQQMIETMRQIELPEWVVD